MHLGGALEFEFEAEGVGDNARDRRQSIPANRLQANFLAPKLELSLFEGENPRWWIRCCERMFVFYQIQELQKVTEQA